MACKLIFVRFKAFKLLGCVIYHLRQKIRANKKNFATKFANVEKKSYLCRKFQRMRIIDSIRNLFVRPGQILDYGRMSQYWWHGWKGTRYDFANLIWYNICDLLTDIIEDVQITDVSGAAPLSEAGIKFNSFRSFVYAWGKAILQRLFDKGYVVIGYDNATYRFWIMDETEYRRVRRYDVTILVPNDSTVQLYAMKSSTYVVYEKSDRELCKGFLEFLNDVLNGSATVSKRLGAVVVASPKNLTNAPTATVLTEEQKKKMEKDLREDYGALSSQSNVLLLPREMSWQVINLAGLDLRMLEKVKTAILAIVDRIKIPANQVAIVDANSSKQLSNGSEIREGDRLKYKTFGRLFERTFVDMAREYGLSIDYKIDGEPIGDTEITV